MLPEFQNWFQITVLCCIAVLGFGRAIVLKIQKTQVVVLDPQMTKTQFINGVFFFVCLFIWIFESFSYAFSLNFHIPLTFLDIVIIQNMVFKFIGMSLLLFSLFIYAMALLSFRDSWRIGIDREKPGKLVTTGIFKYSRNPIYVSLDLVVFGTFLLHGRFIFLILFFCIAVSLHAQVLQEEKFLIQTYRDAYINYQSKVGRYFKYTSFIL